MTWLEGKSAGDPPPGERLRQLLDGPDIVRVPGAHNPLAAQLAQRAGFSALYVSGAAFTASLGLPDIGIITLDEMRTHTAAIYRATGLPLIVDIDTGFGEVINVARTVRELETVGTAAVQMEDQILPKKCGHLSDKHLVTPNEMADKIVAARHARQDTLIIARTDAAAASLDDAIARAQLYLEAGADIIFPEALTCEQDFRAVAKAISAPLLANMTEFGRTPYFTAEQFQSFGYRIVIWPVSSLRIAAKAVEELYAHIKQNGGAEDMLDRMQTRADLYETIGYADYEQLDAAIARGELP